MAVSLVATTGAGADAAISAEAPASTPARTRWQRKGPIMLRGKRESNRLPCEVEIAAPGFVAIRTAAGDGSRAVTEAARRSASSADDGPFRWCALRVIVTGPARNKPK